jgi:hypothetical protein
VLELVRGPKKSHENHANKNSPYNPLDFGNMQISPGNIGWFIWPCNLNMASFGQIDQLWILFEQNRCVLDVLLPLKSNKSANELCVVLLSLELFNLFFDGDD